VGIHRPTHLLKALLIAGIAVASLAGTSVVAHAYPHPKDTHSLHCSSGTVSSSGGCLLTFTDKANQEPAAGQPVCFTVVSGSGTITAPPAPAPSCPTTTTTNPSGQAFATFTANTSGCKFEGSFTEDSDTKATIRATEWPPTGGTVAVADEAGTAQTTVQIECPDSDSDNVHGSPQQTGPGSTTAIATSARNTGASVAPLSAAQVVPVAAIVAVILLLSVAITGRLRLRRLRR
jgi:hypothetical protein